MLHILIYKKGIEVRKDRHYGANFLIKKCASRGVKKVFFAPGLVGIDIGTKTIKAILLCADKGKYVVKKIAKVDNPIKSTFFTGKALEIKKMTKCLNQIARSFPCKRCIVGIPSTHVIMRNLQFPRMEQEELSEAVYWEAQEFFSKFDDEYISDYELLELNENACRVMTVATLKKIAFDYYMMIEDAGFRVEAIDVYPLSYARVLNLAEVNSVTAVIDIGYSHCEITIIEKGKVSLSRNMKFKTALEKSSRFNDNLGTNYIYNENDMTISSLDELVLEILRLLDFYSTQWSKHNVETIVFIGHGSISMQLQEIYPFYFNIPVIDAEQICQKLIIVDTHDFNINEFFSSIGFALRR